MLNTERKSGIYMPDPAILKPLGFTKKGGLLKWSGQEQKFRLPDLMLIILRGHFGVTNTQSGKMKRWNMFRYVPFLPQFKCGRFLNTSHSSRQDACLTSRVNLLGRCHEPDRGLHYDLIIIITAQVVIYILTGT